MVGDRFRSQQGGVMRSFGLIGSLGVVALLAVVACTLDPVEDQPKTGAQSQQLSSEKPADLQVAANTTAPAEAVATPEQGAIVPNVSCSHVVFCNAPGSDGAQCQQDGCSVGAAENECKTEVKTVCGSPITCPLRFFFDSANGGGSQLLGCQPVVCSGGAIECGGHCCGTNATFCAGVGGNSCCDGVHSGGGCPIF